MIYLAQGARGGRRLASRLSRVASVTPSAADPPLGEDSYAQRLATGLCKLGLVLRHEAWRSRGRNGLTPTQGQILALLRAARHDGLRLSEIADGIGVSPATASGSVAALAAKGLLLKESSAGGRRAPPRAPPTP